jgi:4-hydroxy-2-oxoglutarate aldolase
VADGGLELRGIFPPVTTPFDDEGEVDLGGLRRNLEAYAAAPLAGYVVLGTNGEFPHLRRDEKERVIAAAVEAAGDRPVLAQVGEPSLRETVSLARRAAELGARAVLAVTPHYYRGAMDEDALVAYYAALADEAPVPVLLYNIPQNTGVHVTPAVVERCAQHPRIVGIKDSSGNLAQLAEMLERTPPGWGVLNGSSALLVAAAAVGVPGAVLAAADFLPFEVTDVWSACAQGRWAEAQGLEARLRPVLRLVSRLGVPGVKFAMDVLGFRGGEPRAPLRPLPEGARQQLIGLLRAAGLIRF